MLPIKIGNDLVDLKSPLCRDKFLDPRWMEKVCSLSEQRFVESSIFPHDTVWTLWAIKEACYKALKKIDSSLRFIPNRFICSKIDGRWHCSHEGVVCEVLVDCTEDYVHAIALTVGGDHWKGVESAVREVLSEEEHSTGVRILAVELLSVAGVVGAEILRGEDSKAPIIYCEGKEVAGYDVSLSHDHRFVAAAVLNLAH